MKNKNLKKGFTLIELMVVILLLGILAAIAIPSYFSNLESAKAREAIDFIRHWQAARSIYIAENEHDVDARYPVLLGLENPDPNNFEVNAGGGVEGQVAKMIFTRTNGLYIILGTDHDIYCCYTAGNERSEKVCKTLTDSQAQSEQGGILPEGRTCLKFGIND